MRTFYPLLLFASLLFTAGCSKDFLKSYDKRVLGTWKITDVNRYGFNEQDALPFKEEDLLTFTADGALTLQRGSTTYQGSWDIQRVHNGDDDESKALALTVVNFANQQVRSDYFDKMAFTGSNHFKAFINYNTRAYVYHFSRQ